MKNEKKNERQENEQENNLASKSMWKKTLNIQHRMCVNQSN